MPSRRLWIAVAVGVACCALGVAIAYKRHLGVPQLTAPSISDDIIPPVPLISQIIPPNAKPGVSLSLPNKRKSLEARASLVMQELIERKERQPEISAADLAIYGNRLLSQKGFDYSFDNCRLKGTSRPGKQTYFAQLKQTEGSSILIRITNRQNFDGGLCGECFVQLPVSNVLADEMTLMVEGRRYRFARPKDWRLDEASLVDETLHRTIRTWQMPFQTIPLGISADGTKLYLATGYDGNNLQDVVLELDESGNLRFQPNDTMANLSEGKWLTDTPLEQDNDYLRFIRFTVSGNAYTVRFSAPCT